MVQFIEGRERTTVYYSAVKEFNNDYIIIYLQDYTFELSYFQAGNFSIVCVLYKLNVLILWLECKAIAESRVKRL